MKINSEKFTEYSICFHMIFDGMKYFNELKDKSYSLPSNVIISFVKCFSRLHLDDLRNDNSCLMKSSLDPLFDRNEAYQSYVKVLTEMINFFYNRNSNCFKDLFETTFISSPLSKESLFMNLPFVDIETSVNVILASRNVEYLQSIHILLRDDSMRLKQFQDHLAKIMRQSDIGVFIPKIMPMKIVSFIIQIISVLSDIEAIQNLVFKWFSSLRISLIALKQSHLPNDIIESLTSQLKYPNQSIRNSNEYLIPMNQSCLESVFDSLDCNTDISSICKFLRPYVLDYLSDRQALESLSHFLAKLSMKSG